MLLAFDLLDPTSLLVEAVVVLASCVTFLYKKGSSDSREELKQAFTREDNAHAERRKAMDALIEALRSNVLIAERLDAIESHLGIVPRPESERSK